MEEGMARDSIEGFLNDMAARYVPGRRKGEDVFELYATDTGLTYRVRVSPQRCELNVPEGGDCAARIETTSDTFMQMVEGRLNPISALMRGKVRVKGNIALIKDLSKYFDIGI